ncbi:hypothetical protein [Segatella oulorum]|uniref:DUF7833 domain-containing protein n=1 Tax=Segatella oulorum TaxID=28136 RepID=UPI0028E6D3FE|nr:hypothetical protein [Segatella oulorum]
MQNKEIHTSGSQKRPHQPKVSGKFLLLDTRLLNSPDLFRLRETMGMEGWGMALFVLNYLLEHGEWGRAPLHAVTDLARMCHKNKRSMMALLTDYPTLFEIEVGGKVFNSPYLRQCLGGEKIKINQKSCGLETLTNGPSDNQALTLHRIKDERIKKKNDEEKETTAADAAEAVAKKAEKGAKQPAASGTEKEKMVGRPVVKGAEQRVASGTEEVEVVGRPVVKGAEQRVTSGTEEARMVARSVARGAKQRVASAAKASPATNALPHRPTEVASLAPAKAAEENAQHMEQATASPTDSAAKAANVSAKAAEEGSKHAEQATTSPTDSAAKAVNAPEKATKENAQHVEQATTSPTNSATKAANAPEKATEEMSKHAGQVAKQPGFRLETVFTDLAQAARKLPDDERQPLRITWGILVQLYADSLYWQSLERLVGLEVYSQERWKHLALRWFFTYCVTQAKPISALNDAKSYLNHLLQPGRNTRQAFEHYAQTQHEADCRAWQHYRQWCIDNHHPIP